MPRHNKPTEVGQDYKMQTSPPIPTPQGRAVIGQRRFITVLFSDVSDSSEHAERLEAEEYAELLEQFRRFAREVIPRNGGSIARLQGDGVLALFGHLETREDDGRRAAQAALELHNDVARLRAGSGASATVLQMHSGIHSGLVLLIEGDIERGRYDVVGEVPNTAARLCSMAKSGEILVSEESLGPQAQFFMASAPQRVAVRGRSTDLNVLKISGKAEVDRRIDAAARRGLVSFVGRESALAELFDAADQARAGEANALVLRGEPGIGKTRLIDEFHRRLDQTSFCILQGYCESYLGAEPLQPFMQAIRSALGWRPGVSIEENSASTSCALRSFGVEASAQYQTVAKALLGSADGTPKVRTTAILSLITLLASGRALVLVLDDWQWADDASRQVLDALREQAAAGLVLLAVRSDAPEDAVPVGVRPLLLEPLDPAQAQGAIAAWLPDVNPFLSQEIFRQSGGSPLFIEELCHAAAAGADLQLTQRSNGIAWINAMVASRILRLTEPQAECLRFASVAGHTFSIWLLGRLIGESRAIPMFEALAKSDFLIATGQPGMLRFKHALTREAVYATVEPVQRRALHLRVAESLEASVSSNEALDPLEALAYHYDAAGRIEKAAHYAEAAGDKALGAMALDQARAQYITALRSLDSLSALSKPTLLRWCGIAQKLGQACVFDPLDIGDGVGLFDRAARLARETGDVNTLARAEYWLGYVNYGRGRPRAAVKHSEAALGHAIASDDQKLVAQVKATLGQSLASAGVYDRALPMLTAAVESKRQQSRPGSGTAIGSAYTLARIGYTLGDLGRFNEAHEAFGEALILLGDKVHSVAASTRELICAVHLWQGRWEEARVAGLEGAAIALKCRSRYLTAMGRALGACGEWASTSSPIALESLRESTAWIEARGGAVSTSLNYGWLVEAYVDLGLSNEARLNAASLLRRARAQDKHGEAMGHRALARLAWKSGNFEKASRYLEVADKAAEYRNSLRESAVNQLAKAELAFQMDELTEGLDLLSQAHDRFESMQMTWHMKTASSLLIAHNP
jgi:class 3 adenylate cyclase/tetratricopeptide (TPR) repeat protein